MSAILNALSKLEQSIGNLEGATSHVEATLAGQQRDMFGAPIGAPAANGNGQANGVDMNAVAQKLDSAIENVEKVLQEESAA